MQSHYDYTPIDHFLRSAGLFRETIDNLALPTVVTGQAVYSSLTRTYPDAKYYEAYGHKVGEDIQKVSFYAGSTPDGYLGISELHHNHIGTTAYSLLQNFITGVQSEGAAEPLIELAEWGLVVVEVISPKRNTYSVTPFARGLFS